jgi:hypothetical protein
MYPAHQQTEFTKKLKAGIPPGLSKKYLLFAKPEKKKYVP